MILYSIVLLFGYFYLNDDVIIDEKKDGNYLNISVDDIIGYISIDSINLVNNLVQGLDNEFYLSHDYLRGSSDTGEIFLDYQGDLINNKNAIIYSKLDNININNLSVNDTVDIGYLKEKYCYKIDKINIKNNVKYDLLIKVFENDNVNVIGCKKINCAN